MLFNKETLSAPAFHLLHKIEKLFAQAHCAAACPHRECTGGSCAKEPAHAGKHRCETCGWSWF